MQANHALPVAAEHDVPAIAGNGRANAGVQQLLDLVHDLPIRRVHVLIRGVTLAIHDGAAGHEMLHQHAQHLRAKGLPTPTDRSW